MSTNLEDLILDYPHIPKGYPKPFIGMLIRYCNGTSATRDCIVVEHPPRWDKGCIIALETILMGGTETEFMLGENDDLYRNVRIYQIPGLHFSPGKESIIEWMKAITELTLRPVWRNSLVSTLDCSKFGEFIYENGEWEQTEQNVFGIGLPVPIEIADLVLEMNIETKMDSQSLKQMNTDGRSICASCSRPIKTLQGFGQMFNHCPVCEK